MLTDAEKAACRSAKFLKGRDHGYGTPDDGPCPIGAVAIMRGAVPKLTGDGEWTFLLRSADGNYMQGDDWSIAHRAEQDVLAWTGHQSIGLFLDALDSYGTGVFEGLS